MRIPLEDRPLAVVLKHLRFAKQRFDSSADPMAKVAYMLLPLATLLAFIGSDERHKLCDRERAKTLLKKLDSKFALAIGVSADWGLVRQAYLRLFDTTMHDIAKTHSEIQAFKDVLRILFVEGGLFTCGDLEGRIGGANYRPLAVTSEPKESSRRLSRSPSRRLFVDARFSTADRNRCYFGARPKRRTSRRSKSDCNLFALTSWTESMRSLISRSSLPCSMSPHCGRRTAVHGTRA